MSIINKFSKRIKELLEEGVYSADEYQESKNKIEAQLSGARIELNDSSYSSDELETCVNYLTNFIEHLPKFWKALTTDDKTKLNRLLFPEGLIFEEETYRTPVMNPAISIIQIYTNDEIELEV